MADRAESQKASGDGSVRYFLVIEGFDGGSLNKSSPHGFEVSAESFAAINSGAKSTFDPMQLELASGSSTEEIMQYLATGKHIARAQLIAVEDNGKGDPHVVSDIRMSDVVFSAFKFNETGTSSLSLDYAAIQLTNDTGGPAETFGWSVTGLKELTTPIVPANAADETGTTGFKNVSWMVVLDGLDGGVKGSHAGAFELDAFDFDMSMTVSRSGGGGGAGKAQFSPLSMTMDFGSATDEIMNYLMSGKHMQNAQIIGVANTAFGKDKTVYDLRLGDVIFKSADIGTGAPDGDAVHSTVTLDYGAFSLTTANKAGALETAGFNRVNSSQSTTPLALATASSEFGLNEGKTTWYMTIDGLNGGSTAKGHVGAFELPAWAFGGTSTAVISGGSGGGAGKSTLSNFSAFFDSGSTMDDLLKILTSGRHLLHGVQVVGDTVVNGKTIASAFDLRFDDVTVARLDDNAFGDTSAQFAFGAYTLTTKATDGSIETTGWNISNNTVVTNPLVAATVSGDTYGAGPSKKTDFYLTIEGLDGGVDTKGHALSFKVDDFLLGAVGGLRTNGGGGGAGKTTLDPLDIDLELGGASADLLQYLATSRTFSVQLVGDDPTRKGNGVVYDLRLGGVTILDLAEAAKNSGHLSLSYKMFTLTTLDGDGVATTSGFNTTGGAQLTTPLTAPVPVEGNAIEFGQMKYYLVINGLDGGVDTKGHEGAFLLDDFQFDMTQNSTNKSGSLNATLDLGSAADEIMRMVGTGVHVTSAQIIGDEAGKKGVAQAFDLRIGDLTVSALHLDHKGADQVGFSFRTGSISTKDKTGAIETQGYDFASQTKLTQTIAAATASDESGMAGSKMTYYLVIDDLNSGSTQKGHEGAFELDSFSFDATLPANIGGGGGGSGKVTFSPLNVFFENGPAADELLELVAKGLNIASAQIVAEAKIGKQVETVFDLRLNGLYLSNFIDEDQDQGLAMTYQDVSLTTMNSKGETETFAYLHGSTSTTPLTPPVVGEL